MKELMRHSVKLLYKGAGDKMTGGTRIAALLLLAVTAYSQQTVATTPITNAPLPAASYLAPALPGYVLGMLFAYGNRLTTPGNERVTLTGSFVDSAGTGNATVITQIPNQVRIAITGAESKTLIFDGMQATSNGAAATGADLDLLESFQSDTAENFFYSYGKAGARLLGTRFRMDGKTTPGYTGPWYDIYEITQPVTVQGGVKQQKYYYFDSTTGRFAKARYRIQRNGQAVEVQTLYSGWTKSNGQLVPGSIQRLENGAPVFSLTVSGGQPTAGVQDTTFSSP